MATPADQRLLELLEKWLKSLELHLAYSSLDEDSYRHIQPWTEHQRPSRWIIELARQKALALRTQIQERIEMGDAKFSDSLELMTFLANLVGAEHIERFIPLAEPATERAPAARGDPPPAMPADAETATREMPKFASPKAPVPPPTATDRVVRTERKAAVAAKPGAKAATKVPGKTAVPARPGPALKQSAPSKQVTPSKPAPAEAAREQVIADAARLMQWGRKWFELAELIARMADRPPLSEVRRILNDNKAAVDKRVGRG